MSYLRARPDSADAESTREFNDGQTALEGVTRRDTELAGVPTITVQPAVGRPDRTVIYFHGGGYVSGSPPERYLPLAAAVALAANATVHAVDYRLAPEFRFPAAYDDCVSAYTSLVGDGGVNPGSLSVLGDSAGGNLALAVTVAARDRRLPLPARVAMISPFADLTFSGASIEQRRDLDPYVTRALLESMAADYLGDSDPADHRCSAVFADLNGLPPLLIQVGEKEILYDDATRIRDHALSAGMDVTFEFLGARNTRLAGLHRDRPAGVRAGGRTSGDLPQSRCTSCIGERLYVNSPPLGVTKLRDWVRASCQDIGRRYTSELQRRLDRMSGHHSK